MARKLDHLVQFERAQTVDDGLSETEVFAAYGDPVWASREDVSDRERLAGQEVVAGIMSRFVIYADAFAQSLTAKDRLTVSGMSYRISGIKNAAGRTGWLEITAGARTDV